MKLRADSFTVPADGTVLEQIQTQVHIHRPPSKGEIDLKTANLIAHLYLQVAFDEGSRCTNTSCSAYSHKVLEETLTGLRCDGYDIRCQSMDATRQHQNTAYIEEESNYNTLCEDCQVEADEYWSQMRADYYSGCL